MKSVMLQCRNSNEVRLTDGGNEAGARGQQTSARPSGRLGSIVIGRMVLLVASVAVTLLAGEAVCRILGLGKGIVYERGLYRVSSDPVLSYELNPEYAGRSYGTEVKVDSMGLRENELPARCEPNVFRIICVGDSFTFGMGVDAREAWPHVLNEVAALPPGYKKIEVINAGVCGYNLVQYCEAIRDKAFNLNPSLILVGLVENDLAPPFYVSDGYLCVPRKKTALPIPGKRWLQTHSYLYQFAAFRYQQWVTARLGRTNPQLAREIKAQDTDACAAQSAESVLRQTVAEAAAKGIRMIGVALDVPPPSPIPALCERAGLPCIPTTLDGANRLPDGHPNPVGHRDYARQIAAALATRLTAKP